MMDWGCSADCSADAEGWAGMDLPTTPEADISTERDSAWDVDNLGAEMALPAETLSDAADGWTDTDLPTTSEADISTEKDSAWDVDNLGAEMALPAETLSDAADGWTDTDLPTTPEADMPAEDDSLWELSDSLSDDAQKDTEGTDGLLTDMPRTDAEKAADYVRSFSGFEKAADYVERHYDGGEYAPGDVIPVTTRNQDLEGGVNDRGVPFSRREARLDDGLILEGVFPEFNSLHHVELGDTAKDMNLYQQFSACKEDFQDHLSDNRNALEKLTIGDVERLSESNRFTPLGYTWNHNPETGSFDLVSSDEHRSGHTGGNAFYGNS